MPIGEHRVRAVGRLITLVYLATIGALVGGVFALLAIIWLVFDLLAHIILGRPIQSGRLILATPLRHHIKLGKYAIFGDDFPGYNPWATANTPQAS